MVIFLILKKGEVKARIEYQEHKELTIWKSDLQVV